jgi:hypothetical protein
VCDTLCSIGPDGALFAKNSDRQPSEVQLVQAYGARPSSVAPLQTQYLAIPDTGAADCLGARPEWLWGFEHGLNEHRVAIGNEKVITADDPAKQPAGLIGMDLVRLGVERARTADEALDVIAGLLADHGQGGVCDRVTGDAYYSSFILADPVSAWIVETSGRSWVAAPVISAAAISNRLTLGTEWTRSSPDIPAGSNWQDWLHPRAPTGHADVRLASSRRCITESGGTLAPVALAAHLRDHGDGPWGAPGSADDVHAPPETFSPDGTGVTVCMHIRAFQNTTSSMIASLPADPAEPLRAWVAPGQPCVSIYIPVFPPLAVPPELSDPANWAKFARLRDVVEADGSQLVRIRGAFGPLESQLWAEADAVAGDPARYDEFLSRAWREVEHNLDKLLADLPARA